MSHGYKVSAAIAALFVAGAAHAGGYVAPVVDAPVVAPIAEVQAPGSWAGAYAGGSIGYSFGGDDEFGLEVLEDDTSVGRLPSLGNLDVSGPTAGLHVGYRWQRDRLVFGPELGVEFGSVDDSLDFAEAEDSEAGSIVSEINNILSLRMKTGYLVNEQTLVFGTVGAVRGDFDIIVTSEDGSLKQGYNATGYSLGLGVERKLSDRLSLTAEYEYRNFGRTDVDFDDGDGEALRTVATPEHSNIRLGLNFRF